MRRDLLEVLFVARGKVATIALVCICITNLSLLPAQPVESREFCLTSEDTVAAFYMLTKSVASAITLAGAYAGVSHDRQASLLSQIWNDVLSSQVLLATLGRGSRYASFPTDEMEDLISSASRALQDGEVDIDSALGSLQRFLSSLSAWIQSGEGDIESAVGLSLGLVVRAVIQQADPAAGATGSDRPALAQYAEQFERTAAVLETLGFDLVIVPALRLLAERLQEHAPTAGMLERIRSEAEAVEAFISASATVLLARSTASLPLAAAQSRRLDQARVLVLPFRTGGGMEEYEWLARGLANELGTLARMVGVFGSTLLPMEYAAALPQGRTWNDIGSEALADTLGATHVLSGRLDVNGNHARIQWELRGAHEDDLVATGEFEHPLFVSHEIPYRILAALGNEVGRPIEDRWASTSSSKTFENTCRGVAAWLSLFEEDACADSLYQAISFFEEASRADPDSAQAVYNLGLVYLYIDDERALERFHEALSYVGIVNMNLVAGASAVVEGDQQARLGLQDEEEVCLDLRLEAAAQNYRAAIIANPTNAYVHARLASVLSHLDQYEAALQSARSAVTLMRVDGALHELLGSLLLTVSLTDSTYRPQAVRVMEDAIRIGSLDCLARRSTFVDCLPKESYMAELAVAYADWEEWEPALSWAKEALAAPANLPAGEEEVIRIMINNRVAQPARELGREATSKGELRQALRLFQHALEAARILDDEERMSVEWGNIALVYRRLGEFIQARDSYRMAYELTDRVSQQVVLLHNLAVLFAMLGDPDGAEASLARAEGILPQVAPEDASKLEAMIYACRAQLAFNRGDISEAMQNVDDAIAVTPDQELMFQYRLLKAQMLGHVGMLEQSLSMLGELAEEVHLITDREIVGAFARRMLSLYVYGAAPPPELTELAFESAVDVTAKVDFGRIWASVLSSQGNPEQAIAVLEDVLEIAPAGQQTLVHGELGFHLLSAGEYSDAMDAFQRALDGIVTSSLPDHADWPNPDAEDVAFPSLGIELIWGKGVALQEMARQEGDLPSRRTLYEQAGGCFEIALALLDQVRTGAKEEQYASSLLGGTYGRLFEDAISHLVEMADYYSDFTAADRSLHIAEQAKARSTADYLFNSDQNPFALLLDSPDLATTVHNVGVKIDELVVELRREMEKPEGEQSETLIGTLANELEEARREFRSLWEEVLGTRAGTFVSVDVGIIRGNVSRAMDHLDSNEAVLEYMVVENGVYLWVVTHDRISEPIYVPYPRDQLMTDVVNLRRTLESTNPDKIALSRTLASFYEQLVKPGLDLLSGDVSTLVFIPSGLLWYVPFSAVMMSDREAVPSGDFGLRQPYLLEHYDLAYLPSLATLPLLIVRNEAPIWSALLALADPELAPEQVERLGLTQYQYPDLEVACRSFARCLVGDEEVVYAGSAAQERVAHSQATGQQVVVYACHGKFHSQMPLQSELFLAPSVQAGDEDVNPRVCDGDLYAWEVYLDDHHGTELVILAACETLLPALHQLRSTVATLTGDAPESVALTPKQLEHIVSGDEVVGLARAFLSSGAEAVLGTLWQANPEAVEQLLIAMCGYHQQGMAWAQALCQAQRELLSDETFTHVWFWAPYQLVGRWR